MGKLKNGICKWENWTMEFVNGKIEKWNLYMGKLDNFQM